MTEGKVKSIEKVQKTPTAIASTRTRHSGADASPFGFSGAPVPQMAGNLAVQQLFRAGAIQAKLSVSQPHDPDEQEADRVADHVMRMADPGPIGSSPGVIHRKCAACAAGGATCPKCEEEEKIKRKEMPGHTPHASPAVHTQIAALRGGGQPLAPSVRAFFEPRFGRDFSGVRVHTGGAAAESAKAIQAKAFTAGQDIAFGSGQFAPESQDGKRLLAHELVHTIQQRDGLLNSQTPSYIQRAPKENAGGCGLCYEDKVLGLPGPREAGTAVHHVIQNIMKKTYPDIEIELPLGKGKVDLARVNVTKKTIELGEIKPKNERAISDGFDQLATRLMVLPKLKKYKNYEPKPLKSPVLNQPLRFPTDAPFCLKQPVYCFSQGLFVRVVENEGLYLYECKYSYSELLDLGCKCECDEFEKQKDKKPKDKKPKDKEPNKEEVPGNTLPEQLLKLLDILVPKLVAPGLLGIALTIARNLLPGLQSPLGALPSVGLLGIALAIARTLLLPFLLSPLGLLAVGLAALVMGIVHFWDKLKPLREGIAWLLGKIKSVWDVLTESVWDWDRLSDYVQKPTIPVIDVPVTKETTHCVTEAHEDTIVNIGADQLFPINEWKLDPKADDLLKAAAAKIGPMLQKGDRIMIKGYTDNTGSDEYNQHLSEQRAGEVKSWFDRNGFFKGFLIEIEGYGKTRAQYNDTEGRKKDRRVEILVPKHGSVKNVCW